MHRYTTWKAAFVGLLAVLVAAAPLGLGAVPSASAANGSDFRPGMIISDAVFYDGNAMSAGEVQSFLNSKVARCSGANGQPCLKDYRQNTQATPLSSNRCYAMPARTNASAADIIAAVGAACSISPKVLLVLLEKEQGLVTSSAPTSRMYRSATGYGCPDTAACDSTYYGFFNQVYNAAKQFRSYRANPASWRYQAGRVNQIQWHPNAACGSSSVYIENQATAGLYIYTPYQPNAAALANMYGIGNSCSAYGNRNFWRLFTDWFGRTFYNAEADTSITALWKANGGANGKLGPATGSIECTAAGCKRHFANGIVYSPVGGTYAVTGGHATTYMRLGETGGVLGYPRSNETGTPSGGSYVAFQNGYSMWSPATGVQALWGPHATRYGAMGGSESALGYPTSTLAKTGSGGTYVKYEHGITLWSPSTGVHAVPAEHAGNYQRLGGSESKVGYPTTDGAPAAAGGTVVRYQNGLSVWSSRTGAHQLPGGHATSYEKAGGTASGYGYPITDEVATPTGGSYVQYQKGSSIWSPRTGVQLLNDRHGSKYGSLGGTQSILGYPISGVQKAGSDGSYVQYQAGYTLWSPKTGTFSVPNGHAEAYAGSGGSSGPLGFPTSDEKRTAGGGSTVPFQHGLSAWSPGTPVVLVIGGYAKAYAEAGGVGGRLGYPTSAAAPTSDGTRMTFQHGVLRWIESSDSYEVDAD
jgi:uncharacterized protein with LGFP repeats